MSVFLLKLLIAHFLGDFVLQPDRWVQEKLKYKHKSVYMYAHLLVHGGVLLLLLQFEMKYWGAIGAVILSHFVIDWIKLSLNERANKQLLFVLDQVAHLLVIVVLASIYEPFKFSVDFLLTKQSLLLIMALICVTFVASVVMKVIMGKWDLDEDDANDSLNNAGKYIGMLERLFVFGFISIGQWQAIGLLIAAKSVFRFGDLSRARDRKLTEYILIGTLLSFGIAMLLGIGYQYAVKQWIN